jgi:hypothetical protein
LHRIKSALSAKMVLNARLSLDKCWPLNTHFAMSHEHEQKHLLHNWSDCRYRDRPQTPPVVLSRRFYCVVLGETTRGLGICLRKSNRNVSVADVQQGLILKIIFRYFKRLER